MRLENKIALITGAGSVGPGWGNGKATSVAFAREGASIFAADRVPEAAAETQGIITSEGGTCETHICDVTDAAQVEAMIEACVERFGRIDILVNNVGGSVPGGPVDLSLEDWQRQLDFNLTSAFLGCKYAIPHMERQGGGAIVNISSIAGHRHIGNDHVGYNAAKAGLAHFSRATAVKYAPLGIRCNVISPGLMHTPLVEVRLAGQYGAGDAAKLIEKRNKQVPMGRMGEGWDVAYAALYLASDEAKYVTGADLVVDGGLIASAR
jgi:NAD(P)-dependent dehydrogenase (short-subunit alcohol dehydrogenase family)